MRKQIIPALAARPDAACGLRRSRGRAVGHSRAHSHAFSHCDTGGGALRSPLAAGEPARRRRPCSARPSSGSRKAR